MKRAFRRFSMRSRMGDRDGNFNVTPCQTPGIAAISGRYWRRQFDPAQRGETGAYAWYMRI
ncbi:hypothetical protein NUITMVR1_02560 [Raoultella ornithinolytica]|nr:hypothetical protein NUITMVR1_02560 [Raoultella ornithinolytica]